MKRRSAFVRSWLFVAALVLANAHSAAAQRLSDESFSGLVARLSEPGGYFDSDNIISNEASYLQIASQLKKVECIRR